MSDGFPPKQRYMKFDHILRYKKIPQLAYKWVSDSVGWSVNPFITNVNESKTDAREKVVKLKYLQYIQIFTSDWAWTFFGFSNYFWFLSA